jgi:hypothetical protein
MNEFGSASTVSIYSGDYSGASATYEFVLVTTNPIPLTGYLVITLPTGMSMGTSLSMTCVTNCVAATPVYDSTAGTLTLSGIFTSYVAAAATVDFRVTGFVNPSSSGSYSMSVTSYEMVSGSTAYGIDTISNLAVSILSLNVLKVTPSYIFKFFHWYTIAFTSEKDILSTYDILLTFPSTF